MRFICGQDIVRRSREELPEDRYRFPGEGGIVGCSLRVSSVQQIEYRALFSDMLWPTRRGRDATRRRCQRHRARTAVSEGSCSGIDHVDHSQGQPTSEGRGARSAGSHHTPRLPRSSARDRRRPDTLHPRAVLVSAGSCDPRLALRPPSPSSSVHGRAPTDGCYAMTLFATGEGRSVFVTATSDSKIPRLRPSSSRRLQAAEKLRPRLEQRTPPHRQSPAWTRRVFATLLASASLISGSLENTVAAAGLLRMGIQHRLRSEECCRARPPAAPTMPA